MPAKAGYLLQENFGNKRKDSDVALTPQLIEDHERHTIFHDIEKFLDR